MLNSDFVKNRLIKNIFFKVLSSLFILFPFRLAILLQVLVDAVLALVSNTS